MNRLSIIVKIVLCVGYVLSSAMYPVAAEDIDISQCEEKTFRLTAYYSPLKDQSFYYKGNYADEVILNGQGTHGASGQPVFNGMIAAPSSYSFGTQIYFPGWGLGEVEDRGGAIVHAGERGQEYDRIDVWVGKGEEGLKRALSFGVQVKTGYICKNNVGKTGFDRSKVPVYDKFFERTIWIMQLREGRKDPWVETLQRLLLKFGYLKSQQVNGVFDKLTTQALCSYQQKRMGLKSTDFWCGYFGPDTRGAMHRHLNSFADRSLPSSAIVISEQKGSLDIEAENSPVGVVSNSADHQSIDIQQKTANQKALEDGNVKGYRFLDLIAEGDSGKHVKFLQRKLQRLGFYKEDISGVYDRYTKETVFLFQRTHHILQGNESPSLWGYFGPATRKKLNELE